MEAAPAASAKGLRTRNELKAAALRVIARRGYLATKITDITEEAGKAAGSFYRYFTDKDDLLRSVADDVTASLSATVAARYGGEHVLAGDEDVRRHVQSYWDTYQAHRSAMSGIYEASLVSEEFARYWERLRGRHVEIWTRHISEARGPQAADRSAALTALAVVCLLERFCQSAPDAEGEGAAAAVDTLARLISRGILGPA